MRIKLSFQTNSSSASFILRFQTAEDITKDEFFELINEYLDSRRRYIKNLRYWDASNILQIAPNVFEIVEIVSMFNNQEDIPEYMKYMIIASYVKDFDYLDFKFVSFKVYSE